MVGEELPEDCEVVGEELPEDCEVVGEELERDDCENSLQGVHCPGNLVVERHVVMFLVFNYFRTSRQCSAMAAVSVSPSSMIRIGFPSLAVTWAMARIYKRPPGLACLLESVHALGEDVIPHQDHQYWYGGVHEGERTVLQLPCLNPFAVHVGQLFDLNKTKVSLIHLVVYNTWPVTQHLKSSLEAGGIVVPPPHDEETPLLPQFLETRFRAVIAFWFLTLATSRTLVSSSSTFLILSGSSLRACPTISPACPDSCHLNDLHSPGLEGEPVLAHHQAEHHQGEDLTGVRLQNALDTNCLPLLF